MSNKKKTLIEYGTTYLSILIIIIGQHYSFNERLELKILTFLILSIPIKIISSKINKKNTESFFYLSRKILNNDLPCYQISSDKRYKMMDSIQINYLTSLQNSIEENSILLAQARANSRAFNNILDINNRILEYSNLDNLYEYLLEKAIDTIPNASHGSLMKLNEDYTLEVVALHRFSDDLLGSKIDLFDSFIWNETNGLFDKAVIINNISDFNKTHLSNEQSAIFEEKISFFANTSLSAPIIIDGTLHGAINVDTASENGFSEQDASVIMFYANQISSVIKRKITLDKNLYLARYDALTNIYNRGYFNTVMEELQKRAERFMEKFTVIVIDIDNLKKINTEFGHSVGDEALKRMVFLAKENIRNIDIFARLNDDEFVLVMPEMDIISCEKTIRIIKEKLTKKNQNYQYNFDFSYGISSYPEESDDINILLKLADERMFNYRNSNPKI